MLKQFFGSVSLNPFEYANKMGASLSDLLNQPIHVLINWFFLFSFVGYILECVVLSIENRTKVTNRGFTHLPICVIYGFCAIVATLTLSPLMSSPFLIFIFSSFLATSAELITANVMIKLFGGFWWDYSMKKFNYKGMISLETSIGWGLVGIIFFYFLKGFMFRIVNLLPEHIGIGVAVLLTLTYIADFAFCMYKRVTGQETDTEGIGRKKIEANSNEEV